MYPQPALVHIYSHGDYIVAREPTLAHFGNFRSVYKIRNRPLLGLPPQTKEFIFHFCDIFALSQFFRILLCVYLLKHC